jgi:hypothetical protein
LVLSGTVDQPGLRAWEVFVVKRGSFLMSAWYGRRGALEQALTLLAMLAILGSLLILGAANPSSVLGAPGSNTTTFAVAISGAPTAGVPFTVTVTAKDSRGRTVNSYSGGAELTGLAVSPNLTPPSHGVLAVWDGGVSSTTVTATKSQTGAHLTATDVIDGVTVSGQSAAFSVAPASATALAFADATNSFNGQPVDAEFDTSITSSLTTNAPVKVVALDSFGNRVGGVPVTMTSSPDSPTDSTDDLDGTKTGSTNGSAAFGTTPYGEASFSTLSITKFGQYQLTATAGSLTATSASFEIVADLVKCTGSSCKSTGRSAGPNLQITYSSLTGVTTFSSVALTTSFIGDATEAGCGGSADAFGELSEVRVQGAGVTTAQPDFQVAVIMPKETLQVLGLTSRAVDTYDVCLGATRLDGGSAGWTGREVVEGPLVTLDPDSDGVFWGWVADCGTAGLDGDSPCVSLKTKNAGQLQAELGMTKAELRALGFASSDLALVIEKPFPWDGKLGLK